MSARSQQLLAGFEQIEFGSPFVETSSSYSEFLIQLTDVFATLHALYRNPPELPRISLPFHFAVLSLQSVPIRSVSFQGFIPRKYREKGKRASSVRSGRGARI
jgi:hypothetical protein